eukprot:TRINITY_DN105187_c0_g1_i1.p1 TRINITY_DN105187_c0_g1~~TRINITY_DN105187_c0_g1_i1.p1  ORF type:complete len:650 (-),score=114.43 TRINITY_DN105187_c0_g1_i1:76-2025(-)
MFECDSPTTVPIAKRRAGVLCFRPAGGDAIRSQCASDAVEFLLISRRSKQQAQDCPVDDRYTIPAGKFEADADASIENCALREVLEEAGVESELVQDLGWHHTRSKKADEPVATRYFLGSCIRERDDWDEKGSRERCWFRAAEALQKVSYRQDLVVVVTAGLEALKTPVLPRSLPSFGYLQHVAGLETSDDVNRPRACTDGSGKSQNGGVSGERFMRYFHQVGGHFCMLKPLPGVRLEVELPLSHQAAQDGLAMPERPRSGENGHVNGNQVILKPFDATEERFYRQLRERMSAPLLRFTPLFYGTKKLTPAQIEHLASKNQDNLELKQSGPMLPDKGIRDTNYASPNICRYIVLEDLASNSLQPCFLDLKMGCRQRAPRHNATKRAHMAAKAERTTSASLGFRICGMQCFDEETRTTKRYDKYWGQRITADAMTETLALFFSHDVKQVPTGLGRELIEKVLENLKTLEAALQLPGMRFWGSSLLIFFDAAHADDKRRDEFLASVRLKMIDYANFTDVGGDSPDLEFLCGVKNIQIFLESILQGAVDDKSVLGNLSSPPSPEQQDMEQQRAWEALQAAGCNGGENLSEGEQANMALNNAKTVSGATGRTLLREFATSQLMRKGNGSACIPEGTQSRGSLDDVFMREESPC